MLAEQIRISQPPAEASWFSRTGVPFEDARSVRRGGGETVGEAVFTAGMTGYQETLTDPSYRRQVVIAPSPHVGNTGWNDEDDESQRIWVSGFVVREPARITSNWRSRTSLDEGLRRQGIVGIAGVDTRAITRHLREAGACASAFPPATWIQPRCATRCFSNRR